MSPALASLGALAALALGHLTCARWLRARERAELGRISERLLGARGKLLFHWVAFFGIALLLGGIVLVSARLLSLERAAGERGYPQVVLPCGWLLLVAMGVGWLRRRRAWPLVPLAALGLALVLGSLWLGARYPTLGLAASLWPRTEGWATLLLAYAFAASVLPACVLPEPRDLLSMLLVCFALGLALAGWCVAAPPAVSATGMPVIDAFILDLTAHLSALGLPADFGATLIATAVAATALTLLDSGTRLLRLSIEEAGAALQLRLTSNRYVAAGLACTAIAAFAF
jgi:carbon starvation protein CstA